MHYGHGLTGIHHGLGGLVTSHHGLGVHTDPALHYGHDLGNICGERFHGGLLGGHHTVLPLHAARQVSGGNVNPPIKFVINEHPGRNQISGPDLTSLPIDQELGMPLFHTNGFYKPQQMYSFTGINSHPTTTQKHYPDVGDHAMGTEGTHGVGLGVYHGVGTQEQHSKGFSGSHAGLPSALHKTNNIHGTVGLGSYSSAVHPNGFHRIDITEGNTRGLPVRGISAHYGEMVGHGIMAPTVMEIHKNIPAVHGILPSGHENAMAGYHAVVTKGYEGPANMHNFELYSDMHKVGTGKYGTGGYHGNKYHSDGYYGMNGYDQGEHDGGYSGSGYLWNGYHGGGYNGNKYDRVGHHIVNGYHGMNGYLESGSHKSMIAKRHGSFQFGGPLQEPISLTTGSRVGYELKADQNSMSSMFKGETYLKQEEQDNTPYSGKDSSDRRTLMPSTDGKLYTSESLETVTGNVNYKMEDNNENTSYPEGKENKSNDMEEVSGNYTTSSDDLSSKTKSNINISNGSNFLYETGIPMAAQPSVLSDSEWSDTPYARGLHVDLLHGATTTVEAESDVQAAEEIGLTDSQSGIPAKHITRGGSGNHGNPIVLQPQQIAQEPGHLVSSISDELAAGGSGLQGHPSKYNLDGKTWMGYDSCKYDDNGVEYGYRLVPFIYQPWYFSYDQYYMTPYHSSYRLWL
jgi:hypothetical protein